MSAEKLANVPLPAAWRAADERNAMRAFTIVAALLAEHAVEAPWFRAELDSLAYTAPEGVTRFISLRLMPALNAAIGLDEQTLARLDRDYATLAPREQAIAQSWRLVDELFAHWDEYGPPCTLETFAAVYEHETAQAQ